MLSAVRMDRPQKSQIGFDCHHDPLSPHIPLRAGTEVCVQGAPGLYWGEQAAVKGSLFPGVIIPEQGIGTC